MTFDVSEQTCGDLNPVYVNGSRTPEHRSLEHVIARRTVVKFRHSLPLERTALMVGHGGGSGRYKIAGYFRSDSRGFGVSRTVGCCCDRSSRCYFDWRTASDFSERAGLPESEIHLRWLTFVAKDAVAAIVAQSGRLSLNRFINCVGNLLKLSRW